MEGINIYRYKQVDLDGGYSFSKLVSIIVEKAEIRLFPNPASDRLTINAVSGGEIEEVSIYNQMGQKVLWMKLIQGQIDISSLPNGLYFLEAKMRNRFVKKVLVIE